jgi:hypothetical protein
MKNVVDVAAGTVTSLAALVDGQTLLPTYLVPLEKRYLARGLVCVFLVWWLCESPD